MPVLLQINSSANVGSTGRIMEQLGAMMIDEGWESYMAYGRYVSPSSSKLIEVGTSRLSQAIHMGLSRFFDAHGLGSIIATRRFVKYLKDIKPDVVHLHNIHGYFMNYQILFEYLNSTNTPIIWTFHDCWAFTGHCAHFINGGCDKWKTGCFNCPLIKEYPASLLLDRSKENYKKKKELFSTNKNIHIVTVSDWLAGLARDSFFKGHDIRVIGNGVNLQLFKPLATEGMECFVVLALAGVWSEEKGLSDFIKLSYLLDDDIKLVMIGVNDKQKEKLPNKITCIPHTDSIEELVRWYNRASVVLSLSQAETFGLTIAEGMACGTPAIVYNNTAQPELVTEGTGYIVSSGDIDEVYSKIMLIKKHGKQKYAAACRKRAEDNFNHLDKQKQYYSLYQTVTQQEN